MYCTCRTLENNELTGGLSSTWGAPGVFQNLVEIDLSQNWNLSGILLSQWGAPGALPLLQVSRHVYPSGAQLYAAAWGFLQSWSSIIGTCLHPEKCKHATGERVQNSEGPFRLATLTACSSPAESESEQHRPGSRAPSPVGSQWQSPIPDVTGCLSQ